MPDIKTYLTNLTFPYQKIWTLYLAAGTAFVGIILNVFLFSHFRWIMRPSHPMFSFYIGANYLILLCLLIYILESFYQRQLVQFFAPFCRWIKTSDFKKLTYKEYAQMFSQLFPLSDHLTAFKKRYMPLLVCSRFFISLMFISILFLCGISDYFFSQIPFIKSSLSYYHLISMIVMIIYLLLIMHLNCSKLPDIPQANRWLFFLLTALYTVMKSFSIKQDYTLLNDSEAFLRHMIAFTESSLLPLLLICLYCNAGIPKHICFDIREKLKVYDTFMEAFIGYANVLYTIETDTEAYTLLCRYSEAEEVSPKLTDIEPDTYSEKKIQWLFSQRELLLEYCTHFSDDMLNQCQQIFHSLPDWSLCLLEVDFPKNVKLFLQESPNCSDF